MSASPSEHSIADPQLSVVVVIVSDTITARATSRCLAGCLEALLAQRDAPPMEVIVPYHERTDGIADLEHRFPTVRFLLVRDLKLLREGGGSREHHDELRACGLREARGPLIALLEDHGRPAPEWAARIVTAHQSEYAAVGGAVENGVDRALNWAVYFCDFGRYQNPVVAGPSPSASDANVSYKTAAFQAIRATWEAVFHETAVHAALHERGEQVALDPGMVVHQHRVGLTLGDAVRERFIWGRSYAATRSRLVSASARLTMALLSPALPAVLVARMAGQVRRKGRCTSEFVRALPMTLLLTGAWAAGELAGYVTGRTSAGHPT